MSSDKSEIQGSLPFDYVQGQDDNFLSCTLL
jgi:hypothetical protein